MSDLKGISAYLDAIGTFKDMEIKTEGRYSHVN